MEKSKPSFQKVSAIFGLLAGLLLVVYIIGGWMYSTPEPDLSPEAIAQWTKDNQPFLLFYPFGIIAMVFFGVLLHGIHGRFEKHSSPLASLSLLLGWMTLLLKILVLAANWFHLYFNSLVWDAETAYTFFRFTGGVSTLFHVSSLPFLAAWLFVAGIGGMISKGFSKLFSTISILFGVCVVLDFPSWHWEALFSLPPIFWYISSFAWVMLVWASVELLLNSRNVLIKRNEQI